MGPPSSAIGLTKMPPSRKSARPPSRSWWDAPPMKSCRSGASCIPSAFTWCAPLPSCARRMVTCSVPTPDGKPKAMGSTISATTSISIPTLPNLDVPNPYVVHTQPVKGVSNVREIKDNPDAGTFTSSFKLNDPDLPSQVTGLTLAQLKATLQPPSPARPTRMTVEMQAVSSMPMCTLTV